MNEEKVQLILDISQISIEQLAEEFTTFLKESDRYKVSKFKKLFQSCPNNINPWQYQGLFSFYVRAHPQKTVRAIIKGSDNSTWLESNSDAAKAIRQIAWIAVLREGKISGKRKFPTYSSLTDTSLIDVHIAIEIVEAAEKIPEVQEIAFRGVTISKVAMQKLRSSGKKIDSRWTFTPFGAWAGVPWLLLSCIVLLAAPVTANIGFYYLIGKTAFIVTSFFLVPLLIGVVSWFLLAAPLYLFSKTCFWVINVLEYGRSWVEYKVR